MKEAISNIVTEIIFIAISVLLIAIIYAWIASILTQVKGLALPKLPEVMAATLSYAKLRYSYAQTYNYGYYILVTISNHARATIKSLTVYLYGRPICVFDKFVVSADAANLRGKGLQFAGYYGDVPHQLDEHDSLLPGLILLSLSNQGNSTTNVGYNAVDNGYYTPISPLGEEAPPWCSVFSGYFKDFMLSPSKLERYLAHSSYILTFSNVLGKVKVFYNTTSLTWVYLDAYKKITLSKGVYTFVIWCPKIRGPIGSVTLELVTDMYTFKRKISFP